MDAVTDFVVCVGTFLSNVADAMMEAMCFSFFGRPCSAKDWPDSPMSHTCLAPDYADTFRAAGGRICGPQDQPARSVEEVFEDTANEIGNYTQAAAELVLPESLHVYLTHDVCIALAWMAMVLLGICFCRLGDALENRARERDRQDNDRHLADAAQVNRVVREMHTEYVRKGIKYWRKGRTGPKDSGDVKILYDNHEWVSVSGIPTLAGHDGERLYPEIDELLEEAGLVYARLPMFFSYRTFHGSDLIEEEDDGWYVGRPISNPIKSAYKR